MPTKPVPVIKETYLQDLSRRVTERTKKLQKTNKRLEYEIMERTLAQEELQQSEEAFRLLIRSVKEYAIFMLTPEGKILTWNEGAERIFGYKSNDIIGKSGALLLTIEDQNDKRFQREIQTALTYEHNEDEKWFVRKNGTQFWGSGAITTIRKKNGQLINLVKIVHDMTDFKEREQQKNDFISIASHEFKTPLTSLKAYTEYLRTRFQKTQDQQSVELMKKMEIQLEKLVSLIRDLLDFTRIEAGKLPYHESDFIIQDLISEVREEVQRITERQIIEDLDGVTTIFGDRERIGQVITNFLSNAIAHTQTDKIIIRAEQNANTVTVSVQDFGKGLPAEVIPRVFDRYFRGTQDTPGTQGMGLGLYICSEIIKRHNGKIWVKSKVGKGSTFGFTIPVRGIN